MVDAPACWWTTFCLTCCLVAACPPLTVVVAAVRPLSLGCVGVVVVIVCCSVMCCFFFNNFCCYLDWRLDASTWREPLHEFYHWHWRRLTLSTWRCWRFDFDVDESIMTTMTVILSIRFCFQPLYGCTYKKKGACNKSMFACFMNIIHHYYHVFCPDSKKIYIYFF